MSNNLSTSLYKYTPIKDRMSYNVNIEIYLCLGDTSISYIYFNVFYLLKIGYPYNSMYI